jgi:hypothetical protein
MLNGFSKIHKGIGFFHEWFFAAQPESCNKNFRTILQQDSPFYLSCQLLEVILSNIFSEERNLPL